MNEDANIDFLAHFSKRVQKAYKKDLLRQFNGMSPSASTVEKNDFSTNSKWIEKTNTTADLLKFHSKELNNILEMEVEPVREAQRCSLLAHESIDKTKNVSQVTHLINRLGRCIFS